MDLYCPKCRELWDNDTFHEVAEELGSTYAKVAAVFRSQGCGAAFRGSAYDPGRHCSASAAPDPMVAAMYDMLGDDMDGAAAMFEDMADLFD